MNDEQSGARFVDYPNYKKRYWSQRFFEGMLKLKAIADDFGISLTHLSLAWMAQGDKVNSILLGPSSLAQFEDCFAAGEVRLPEECMDRIRQFQMEFEGSDASYAR
jgi:aryl-alcohol dehydrogenase-like predicted oxidoreductase